jgi:predicted lactoylglutathione lyase
MATKIFVNLPVKDLKRSVGLFTTLGYTLNPTAGARRMRSPRTMA